MNIRSPMPTSAAALLLVLASGNVLAGDAAAGASAWVERHSPPDGGEPRTCATCHGRDLTRPGRHAKTGKAIEPLAPSVNPARLSDDAKVQKWLRRNCRWTLGRECTAAEKADFLAFIESQ
jgi:hypothetical protein